jgi:uncharacterized protein (TIGR03492 family)
VDLVLAVGDILPLALAWQVRRPYIFMGCTKSDYYSPGRSCYLWPERLLMRHPRCLYTFTRDQTTAEQLTRLGVAASCLGNPMMDGLMVSNSPPTPRVIGLLPGSRPLETQANFLVLLACADQTQRLSPEPLNFMAALAPGLDLASFVAPALARGWEWQAPYLVRPGVRVWLRTGAFGEILQQGQLFFAMAGTATEQTVGLGRPVVTIPGAGPQFTRRFAELQRQLLGESILLATTPEKAAQDAWEVLHQPEQLARIQRNGQQRMGGAGASASIARFIAQRLSRERVD